MPEEPATPIRTLMTRHGLVYGQQVSEALDALRVDASSSSKFATGITNIMRGIPRRTAHEDIPLGEVYTVYDELPTCRVDYNDNSFLGPLW